MHTTQTPQSQTQQPTHLQVQSQPQQMQPQIQPHQPQQWQKPQTHVQLQSQPTSQPTPPNKAPQSVRARIFGEFSFVQVFASILTTIISVVLSSRIGIYGGLLGAAVGAGVAAIANQLFRSLISVSADKLKELSPYGNDSEPAPTNAATTPQNNPYEMLGNTARAQKQGARIAPDYYRQLQKISRYAIA